MTVSSTSYGMACGAKTASGGTCKQPGIAPSGRCRFHGGMTPRGAHTNSYRALSGKGWDDKLTGNLLETFERLRGDPEVMNLTAEIAVVTAHLQEQVARMQANGESPQRMLDARLAFREAMFARRRKQSGAYAAALERLESILRDDELYARSWDDILKGLRTLERLVAREHKRRIDLHSVMTTEQAVSLLSRMMSLVTTYVNDEESLKGLHKGFRDILVGSPHLARGMAQIAANREAHGDPNVMTQSDLIDVAHEGFTKPDWVEAELVD